MISPELASALADLRSALVVPDEFEDDGSSWNEVVLAALDRVAAFDNPAAVAPLLALLDDAYECQDVLWGVMHAAERFPAEPYAVGLVAAVPFVAACSPEWGRRLVARVLNSESARAALEATFTDASTGTRSTFCVILGRLATENPGQFRTNADRIIASLRDDRGVQKAP